jgi:glycine/D-amino acid oxidase-like deaminating enzyme
MDLYSNYPYWLLKEGLINDYPYLAENMHTEVAIIGGGITGALAAYFLVKAGVKVTVLDKRHIGMGSTAASTALLQYEIDKPLHKLIKQVGKARAVQAYLASYQSLNDLIDIITKEKFKVDLKKLPSMQYASFKKDVEDLQKELVERKKIGIPVSLLADSEIKTGYGFTAPAGLLSPRSAQVNAYRLTHEIFSSCYGNRLTVFGNTEVSNITHGHKKVTLQTSSGKKITCKKLIIACGYESQKYIPKPVEILSTTYAIISDHQKEKEFWYKNSLIWETAHPYLYIRTSGDGRILVGGKDDPFSSPFKREENLPQKAVQLQKSFEKLFPHIPFKTDFKWAGVFGGTKDSLPYIGSIPQRPNTFFSLGFGGNGITFSVIAAQIICDTILGKRNEYTNTFSFQR